MKRLYALICVLLLTANLLCGCAKGTPAEASTGSVASTPAATEGASYDSPVGSYTLQSIDGTPVLPWIEASGKTIGYSTHAYLEQFGLTEETAENFMTFDIRADGTCSLTFPNMNYGYLAQGERTWLLHGENIAFYTEAGEDFAGTYRDGILTIDTGTVFVLSRKP